ncbi:MAG: hypothetical protein J3K34DRAFT_426171 [Monoraphidium minutum]|nr:MAG: hypothetical protein J3K34DRAFT_426171 [Monoraphidium minutum]
MLAQAARSARPASSVGAKRPSSVPRLCPVVRAQSGGSSGNPSVDDILAQANALLDSVAGGSAPQKQYYSPGVQESIDELTGLGFVCDESGCVLVLPTESTDDEGGEALNTLMEGNGWRLGALEDPENPDYPALAAGPGWLVPLTSGELGDVLFVLQQLRSAVSSLRDQGQWLPAAGDRPASRAKWQSRQISMQATFTSGPAFAIELTVRTGRRNVIVHWPTEAVADLCARLDGAGVTSAPAPAKTVAAA